MKTKNINELLKKEILEKGSFVDFAKSNGMSKQYLHEILNEKTSKHNKPKVKILIKLGYLKTEERIDREIFLHPVDK